MARGWHGGIESQAPAFLGPGRATHPEKAVFIVEPQAETCFRTVSDYIHRAGEEAERLLLEQLSRSDRDTPKASRRACGGACYLRVGRFGQRTRTEPGSRGFGLPGDCRWATPAG